ncbi:MAG TPA: four helix bundle protein [Gemmatimonadaceae bacterium]
MGDFRKLEVWKVSYALALDIYRATQGFPRSEQFGLVDQLRRAAASIPAIIAEGCGRNTDAELARHVSIALGEANEVETFLCLARDLGYLTDERLLEKASRISRMLNGLRESLRQGRRRAATSPMQ